MISAQELVDRANAEVVTIGVEDSAAAQASGDAVLVDIRDIRELNRVGRIPGAIHAPRGMLEFWVDPESPYHRDVFAQEGKTYILFCAAAGRSALAAKALQDMGFGPVAHMEGGFGLWTEKDMPVDLPDPKE
ncbi:MAG: rhodanese-like domain-containing protein [Pseudomonadota bacterium]